MKRSNFWSSSRQSGSSLLEAILAMAIAAFYLTDIYQAMLKLAKWEARAKSGLQLFLDPRSKPENCSINSSGVRICNFND